MNRNNNPPTETQEWQAKMKNPAFQNYKTPNAALAIHHWFELQVQWCWSWSKDKGMNKNKFE